MPPLTTSSPSRQRTSRQDRYKPTWSGKGRVSSSRLCPICQHTDWCNFDDNDNLLVCMRSSIAQAGWLYIKPASNGGYLFKSDTLSLAYSDPYANITIADLRPKQSQPQPQPQPEQEGATNTTAPGPKPAQDEILHAVYTDLLAPLTLTTAHRKLLTDPTGNRKLTAQGVEAIGVKSYPGYGLMQDVCARLEKKYGQAVLLTVPGFYLNPKGVIALAGAGSSGMLLPSFDGQYITGLRIRSDQAGKDATRYYWLSSANEKYNNGPAAKVRASIYYPLDGIKQPGIVGITEGEFKARIAADKLGYPFISTPGTSSWKTAQVVELAKATAPRAIIFYDNDSKPKTREQTIKHRTSLADASTGAGLQVSIAEWPLNFKGIDDLLLAGREFTSYRHITGLTGIPVDRTINEQYLPDITPTKKITLIKSPKGSGKTQANSRLVKSLPKDAKVLSVGHRVTLLGELSRRFGLEFYQDFNGTGRGKNKFGMNRKELTASPRLAICLDSLVHFESAGKYNYLIIDEVEQVLRHLTGNTIKDRRRPVIAMLCTLIERADYVIALDADLSSTTYRFFERLLGADSIEVVVNEFTRQSAPPMLQYDNRNALMAALFEKLKAGIKCAFFTNSIAEAKTLELSISKQFPDLKVLCVHQENSAAPEVRQIINNLNLYAPGYDVMIASPTLGTGIDINVKHFTETFLHGVHGSTNHTDLLQHMARNRQAETIHAWIEPGQRKEPTDPEYWQQQCIKNFEETKLYIEYSPQTGQRVAAPFDLDYLQLWSDIKATDVASHNNLAGNFYAQAEREGYKIIAASAGDQAAISAAHTMRKDAAGEIEQERKEAILNAPDIFEMQAQELEAKPYLTKSAKARLEKYRISHFYNLPVDAELIETDNKGRTMQRLTEFMMCRSLVDTKEIDLKIAEDTNKMLPDARNYTLRKELRIELIKAASGPELATSYTAGQLRNNGFVALALANKERIHRVLNYTLKDNFQDRPVELLSALVSQLNLKLECHKKGKKGSQVLTYTLNQASIETMLRLAKARKAGLDAQHREDIPDREQAA